MATEDTLLREHVELLSSIAKKHFQIHWRKISTGRILLEK